MEELAQEAFLRAHRSWETISGYDKPGAWLRRVTINLANSYLRTRVSEVKALEKLALRRIDGFRRLTSSTAATSNPIGAIRARGRPSKSTFRPDNSSRRRR